MTGDPDRRSVRRVFEASSELFANPERGYHRYSETHLGNGARGHLPLDPERMSHDRTAFGISLVFRYVYLGALRHHDRLPPGALDQIQADLARARDAGVKLILRFAYSDTTSEDAPPERVVAHIRQIAPVLNANSDVVFALQAGFVGRWGEWYYTDNFGSDPERPWILTARDERNRQLVLSALLDLVDPEILLQVRRPGILAALGARHPRARSIGIHNDALAAGPDDLGTYRDDGDRRWMEERSAHVLIGGETSRPWLPFSSWSRASVELRRYHWTHLNADYHPDVLGSWGLEGRELCARHLGHRLRLLAVEAATTPAPERRVSVTVDLTNDGWAAPVRQRNVYVTLCGSGQVLAVAASSDSSTWQPGCPVRVQGEIIVPASGRYRVHLVLPDRDALAPGQGDDRRAVPYAIRLANPGLWDPRRGWNDLGIDVAVD